MDAAPQRVLQPLSAVPPASEPDAAPANVASAADDDFDDDDELDNVMAGKHRVAEEQPLSSTRRPRPELRLEDSEARAGEERRGEASARGERRGEASVGAERRGGVAKTPKTPNFMQPTVASTMHLVDKPTPEQVPHSAPKTGDVTSTEPLSTGKGNGAAAGTLRSPKLSRLDLGGSVEKPEPLPTPSKRFMQLTQSSRQHLWKDEEVIEAIKITKVPSAVGMRATADVKTPLDTHSPKLDTPKKPQSIASPKEEISPDLPRYMLPTKASQAHLGVIDGVEVLPRVTPRVPMSSSFFDSKASSRSRHATDEQAIHDGLPTPESLQPAVAQRSDMDATVADAPMPAAPPQAPSELEAAINAPIPALPLAKNVDAKHGGDHVEPASASIADSEPKAAGHQPKQHYMQDTESSRHHHENVQPVGDLASHPTATFLNHTEPGDRQSLRSPRASQASSADVEVDGSAAKGWDATPNNTAETSSAPSGPNLRTSPDPHINDHVEVAQAEPVTIETSGVLPQDGTSPMARGDVVRQIPRFMLPTVASRAYLIASGRPLQEDAEDLQDPYGTGYFVKTAEGFLTPEVHSSNEVLTRSYSKATVHQLQQAASNPGIASTMARSLSKSAIMLHAASAAEITQVADEAKHKLDDDFGGIPEVEADDTLSEDGSAFDAGLTSQLISPMRRAPSKRGGAKTTPSRRVSGASTRLYDPDAIARRRASLENERERLRAISTVAGTLVYDASGAVTSDADARRASVIGAKALKQSELETYKAVERRELEEGYRQWQLEQALKEQQKERRRMEAAERRAERLEELQARRAQKAAEQEAQRLEIQATYRMGVEEYHTAEVLRKVQTIDLIRSRSHVASMTGMLQASPTRAHIIR